MEWLRAMVGRRRCGGCGAELVDDAPIKELTLAGGQKKYRCEGCAGPAPPDLPAVIVPADATPAVRPFQSIAHMLPLDWGQRAVGERDPGEDG